MTRGLTESKNYGKFSLKDREYELFRTATFWERAGMWQWLEGRMKWKELGQEEDRS